jgi:hypothetical protein
LTSLFSDYFFSEKLHSQNYYFDYYFSENCYCEYFRLSPEVSSTILFQTHLRKFLKKSRNNMNRISLPEQSKKERKEKERKGKKKKNNIKKSIHFS